MAGLKGNYLRENEALLVAAFLSCVGMTLVILACAIPEQKIWWPLFVVLFYLLSILPNLVAKRRMSDPTGTNPCSEFALFLTAGIILSTFALPIVLARAVVITWTACILTLAGNLIMYITIFGYALRESDMEGAYGGMF